MDSQISHHHALALDASQNARKAAKYGSSKEARMFWQRAFERELVAFLLSDLAGKPESDMLFRATGYALLCGQVEAANWLCTGYDEVMRGAYNASSFMGQNQAS